jgi:polyisoprenoid-binding protein YceI
VSQSSDDKQAISAPTDVGAFLRTEAAVGSWVLDPTGSRVEFHVKHFWGVITVHGSFAQVSGEGTVGVDGALQGQLRIDGASLSTKNKKRDEHLRSADFFDVEHHPQVVVTVTSAQPSGPAVVTGRGTLEAAGHVQPIELPLHIAEISEQRVTLRAELEIDRTGFAMTWSPMGMASKTARVNVLARFVRS